MIGAFHVKYLSDNYLVIILMGIQLDTVDASIGCIFIKRLDIGLRLSWSWSEYSWLLVEKYVFNWIGQNWWFRLVYSWIVISVYGYCGWSL